MEMDEKVLCKKAKELELKGSQKNKINPLHIPALGELLHDVHAVFRPKESDYYNRKDLIRIFSEIAKEIYGKCNDFPLVLVEEFGSFLMDIFSAKSDLDLSVNFSSDAVDFPREKKIRALRKFAKVLYALQRKGHVSRVQQILTAKVPILKVVDRGTGIECDISIENRDGIVKSHIIRMISSIDERFQMLSFLMKAWAKAHGINSSKERTLNSISIISLVAFHLQTRDPPILPPFSALFKDGTDPAPVGKIVNNFLNYGKRNEESLSELFVNLLIKLASVETLWPNGLCASTYEGSWILKTWDSFTKKTMTWDSKSGCISVEDFTDRSQNVARAVGKIGVTKIYECIHLSIQHIFDFMDGKIQGTKLREFLFGRELIPALVDKCTTTLGKRKAEPSLSIDHIEPKKKKTKITKKKKKKMQSTGCSGETERAIPVTPIQTKNTHSTQDKGGTRKVDRRGTPLVGRRGTPTASCGGTPSVGCRGPLTVDWVGTPTVGWGGTPAVSWGGTPAVGWGGTPTVIWGGTPSLGWGGTPPMVGWGGTTNQAINSPFTSGGPFLRPHLLLPPQNLLHAQQAQPGHHQISGHGRPRSNGYRRL